MPDEGRGAAPDIQAIRGFAEASPAAIAVLGGPAHRLLYVNPAFALAAGQDGEDLLNRTAAEAFPALAAGGHLAPLDTVRTTGQPCRSQARPIPLGRPGRLWDAETSALRGRDGTICGVLAQLRDVTEAQARLRRAEASAAVLDAVFGPPAEGHATAPTAHPTAWVLRTRDGAPRPGPPARAPDARYRALVEAGALAIWTASAEGEVISAGGWGAMTGQTPAEVVGWGWLDAVHPEDRGVVRDRWSKALAMGHVYDCDFRVRRPDGDCRWTAAHAAPLRDAAGDIVEWLGVNTDIDDRKRAERALRDSEARFRTLAEAMPHLVWQTDPDGEPDYLNSRWEEVTGLGLGQLRSGGWQAALHAEDRPVLAAAWNRALAEGGDYDADARILGRSGEYRWYRVKAAPVRNAAGAIRHWVGTCTDIEQRHTDEARLRDALAARERLAREADHRIKNSLQLVAALLRLQAGRVAEPAARVALEAATARVQAVAEAHRALQLSPDFRSIRLSDMLRELAGGATVQHPAADIRASAPDTLALDAERAIPLALILSELLTNALRHAYPAGRSGAVRLAAWLEDGAIVAEVSDSGTGMPPDAASSLGDTVIRTLAKQIGARLATESSPGRGTRVTLRLALDPTPRSPPP